MRTRRPEHPGITFRSKLEAQWSVVLDALQLPWAFEPVKFDLPSGIYIPDFKIYPEPGDERAFWIEVKGPWPNAREFEVASEINIYAETPLMILSGDVPRQANGGTAWFFDDHRDMWSMLRPEEALIRVIYRHTERKVESLGELWELALQESRDAELIKVES
jgi:hypothetical protein